MTRAPATIKLITQTLETSQTATRSSNQQRTHIVSQTFPLFCG